MVGSIVKATGKIGIKAALEVGAHDWKWVRGIMRENNSAIRLQHFHHPFLKQSAFKRIARLRAIFNQPFMVTPLKACYVYRGTQYSMHGFHMLLDGRKIFGQSMSLAERLWYGTTLGQKSRWLFWCWACSTWRAQLLADEHFR
ncbi:MAG: hypothetical protein ACOYON_11805 [Fimbriimonas sp.]